MRKIWFLALVILTGCQECVEKDETRYVRFALADLESPKERLFAGVAKADQESELSFRVGGTLECCKPRMGAYVSAGDVIARIDPTDFALKVEEAKSLLLEVKAKMRKAEAHFFRISTLYETESASAAELDAARTEYESAIAKFEVVKTQLMFAQRQLEYTVLKAPIDGTIAKKYVSENENVRPGDLICLINSWDKVNVKTALPELLLNEISEGSRAEIVFNASPDAIFSGVITEIGVADPKSTTFPVTLELQEKAAFIRSGMTADVIFRVPSPCERVIVPPYAVFSEKGNSYLFTLNEKDGNTFVKKQRVEMGELRNSGLSIVSGVKVGEKVVTAGIHQLKDGQRVKLL